MSRKNIGQNIRKIRMMRNMTRAQLAENLGVSIDHISHVETGSSNISLSLLMKICDLLDVTPNEILIGEYSCDTYRKKGNSSEAETFDDLSQNGDSDDMMLLKYMHHFLAGRK